MKELRKFLGLLFGFTAFSLAATMLSPIIRATHGSGLVQHVLLSSLNIGTIFLIACSILNGMACWAVLMNSRRARVLGIAASITPLAVMAALIVVALTYRSPIPFFGLVWITLGLAVAGLIAFIPRNSTAQVAEEPPIPIKGDGTTAWVNKSIWIIGIVLFFYGIDWWYRWGSLHNLAKVGWASSLFQCVIAELLIVLLHELGHTLTGLALGMKLRAFIIGPFQWHMREGKWEFQFRPTSFLSTGGATALVPADPHQPLWRDICMIAAGPLTSLISGLLTFWAALNSPRSPWESIWFLLASVATLSLLAGLLNLVPFQTGLNYSDGAHLYQLALGGPWADYHRAVSTVMSTLVTPLRPRDYDLEAIQRAAAHISCGQRTMLLHLYASSYYMDRAQLTEAGHAFAQAEAVYNQSAPNITAELHTAFIFRKAFLHRDAIGARQWWERMEAKKPTRFNVDYWLARAALLWSENNLDEAKEALDRASSLALQLPTAGAYEFDRYRCTLLRQSLKSGPAENTWPLRVPQMSPSPA
jgi:hypothetical protein